jgi:hypothetical protein
MSRLIDTDTAYEALTEYYNHHTDVQHQALEEALNMVETADAIPVPWIKAQMKELESAGYMAEIGALGIKAILIQWEKKQKG